MNKAITSGLVALALAASIGCNDRDSANASSKVGDHVTVVKPEGCYELVFPGVTVGTSNFYDIATCKDENGNFTVYIKGTSEYEWTAREWR